VSTQPRYTHRDIQEFLGVYALDAMDGETASMVELHLAECMRCSIEVAQHHEVAGLMANSGGASPTDLWDIIVGRLDDSDLPSWERLAQSLESGDGHSERFEGPVDDQAGGTAESRGHGPIGAPVVPITSKRRGGRMLGRATGIAAAAAVVAALVLGAQVNHLNHQVNALQAPTLLTQAEQAALNTPSTKQVHLTALRGATSAGRVTVILTRSGTGFVEAEGLSSLPKTETYQLWGVIGSQTISLGLLGSDPAVVPFSVAGDIPVEAIAITAEQSGGVVQSSNQPVVAGEVAA
jgi:hypothetical protein